MFQSITNPEYADLYQDPETFLHLTAAANSASLERLIELREEAALAADLAFEEPTIEEDACCPFCHPHACDCAQRPAYLLQQIPVGQSGTIQGREVTREAMNTFFVSGFNIRVSAPTAAGLLAA